MVAILLKHSANANLPNFLFGRTPLHYAAEGNHFDCIKILVAYNGDL